MNLEQIDTSTTAGKARVMQLAAEGRRVAVRISKRHSKLCGVPRIWESFVPPSWNWVKWEYAIIAEPVGPEYVWIAVPGHGSVRYIRADLAGEKG